MVNEIAEMLRKGGAVVYGDFTLASGKKSHYYIDVKSVLTNLEILGRIGHKIQEMCEFDVVAGVAVGGVPIAVAVSLASRLPYAIIRSSDKTHGKENRIIGDVREKKVVLVEDVITSGGSVLYGIEELRLQGAHVECVVAIVDRKAGAEKTLADMGIALLALTNAAEILEGIQR